MSCSSDGRRLKRKLTTVKEDLGRKTHQREKG